MSLNFSSIQDVYGCDYSELSRNKNKHSTTLEQEMVTENNRVFEYILEILERTHFDK